MAIVGLKSVHILRNQGGEGVFEIAYSWLWGSVWVWYHDDIRK